MVDHRFYLHNLRIVKKLHDNSIRPLKLVHFQYPLRARSTNSWLMISPAAVTLKTCVHLRKHFAHTQVSCATYVPALRRYGGHSREEVELEQFGSLLHEMAQPVSVSPRTSPSVSLITARGFLITGMTCSSTPSSWLDMNALRVWMLKLEHTRILHPTGSCMAVSPSKIEPVGLSSLTGCAAIAAAQDCIVCWDAQS